MAVTEPTDAIRHIQAIRAEMDHKRPGVWATCSPLTPRSIWTLHAYEVVALRQAVGTGCAVIYLPYGCDVITKLREP
jgi:hypothetical protein